MKAPVSILIVGGFLICGCFRFSPDGRMEEAIEEEIKEVTGLDIDLTSTDGK